MNNRLKRVPAFKSEAAERRFWQTHGATGYFDAAKSARVAFANWKPSTQTISLCLTAHLLDGIKAAANSRDVPYQSLIKVWLQEKLQQRSG
jgi:predicted DNA binding CopG/RHH family protein